MKPLPIAPPTTSITTSCTPLGNSFAHGKSCRDGLIELHILQLRPRIEVNMNLVIVHLDGRSVTTAGERVTYIEKADVLKSWAAWLAPAEKERMDAHTKQ
jgi:hypothetical protein